MPVPHMTPTCTAFSGQHNLRASHRSTMLHVQPMPVQANYNMDSDAASEAASSAAKSLDERSSVASATPLMPERTWINTHAWIQGLTMILLVRGWDTWGTTPRRARTAGCMAVTHCLAGQRARTMWHACQQYAVPRSGASGTKSPIRQAAVIAGRQACHPTTGPWYHQVSQLTRNRLYVFLPLRRWVCWVSPCTT